MSERVLYTIASRLGGGGIGSIAYYEALGLARSGLLCEAVCLGAERTLPAGDLRRVRFPSRRLFPLLPERRYFRAKNLWFDRQAKRSVKRCDCLHAWSAQCPGAIRKAAKLGLPVTLVRASTHILTQNRWLAAEYEHWGIRPVLTLSRVIEECLEEYEIAERIVVPSPLVKDSFVAQGVDESKIRINQYGIDAKRFVPGPKKEGGSTRILFVGEVGVRKGALRLLAAFERLRLPGAVLELAGAIKPEIAAHLKPYRDRQDIIFHGHVDDVRPLYRRADLLAFPTVEDGWGLVVYEAMACGLPVVTTDRAGAILTHQQDGFVLPYDDRDALCHTLSLLAKDPDLRARIGAAARQTAERRTWDDFGDQAAAMYGETDRETDE